MKESTEDLKAKVLEFKKQEAKLEKEILDKRAVILEYETHIQSAEYKTVVYPKNRTKYWHISHACVVYSKWSDTITDKDRFNKGNYFATKQEADLAYEWQILNTQILNSIAMLNEKDHWVLDREDPNQKRWFLRWDNWDDFLYGECDVNSPRREDNHYTSRAGIKILRTLHTEKEFKFWLTNRKRW